MRRTAVVMLWVGVLSLGVLGMAPGWLRPVAAAGETVDLVGAPARVVVGDVFEVSATVDPPTATGFFEWTFGRISRGFESVIPDCIIFSDQFANTTTIALNCEPPLRQSRDPNIAFFTLEVRFFPTGEFEPVVDTEIIALDLSSPRVPYIRDIVPNPPPAPGFDSFFDVFVVFPDGWQVTNTQVNPPGVSLPGDFQWQFVEPTATVDLLDPDSNPVQIVRTIPQTLIAEDLWQDVLDAWVGLFDLWAVLYAGEPAGSPEKEFADSWNLAKAWLCDGSPMIDHTLREHGLTEPLDANGAPLDDIGDDGTIDPNVIQNAACARVRINPRWVCNNEPSEWKTPGDASAAVPRQNVHISLKLILAHEMRHVAEICANQAEAALGNPLPIPTLNDSECICYAWEQQWGVPWSERFDRADPERIKAPGLRVFGPTFSDGVQTLLSVAGTNFPEITVPGIADEILITKFARLVNNSDAMLAAGISARQWPTNILRFPGLGSVTDLSLTTADDFLIVNRSPEVVLDGPTVVNFDANGIATINVDASGSFDADGIVRQREWFLNHEPQPLHIDTEIVALELRGIDVLGQRFITVGHVLTDDGFGFPVAPAAITPEEAEELGSLTRLGEVLVQINDATPPAVAVDDPGETLSCCVTLRANASDNVAVQSVEFFIDGESVDFGEEVSPGVWEASGFSADGCTFQGALTVTAVATDFWGNTTTSGGVVITVDNEFFSDVDCTNAVFNFITNVVCNGIAAGFTDGTYRPANLVTRAQMAVFMARSADAALGDFAAFVPPPCGSETFPDVDCNHFAYKFIEYIVSKGIAAGFADGTFGPGRNVSRDAMAVFLSRVRNIIDGDFDAFTPPDCGSESFSDVPCTHPTYKFIEYIRSKGITIGFQDGTYRPQNRVRRDQMAVFVSRAAQPALDCPLDE